MKAEPSQPVLPRGAETVTGQMRHIQGREWWLWALAVTVTLMLTVGLLSFTVALPVGEPERLYWPDLPRAVRGVAALVLLFDFYTLYQQLQIHRMRRRLMESEELFRLISENAADMIAVTGVDGSLLYSSPAYHSVLGYSREESDVASSFDQIHPDDRERVKAATENARLNGKAQRLEYRIRHKDGSWRILESVASVIRDRAGRIEKLVVVNRDITERKHAEAMLAHNAFHDALTDLPNRALFLDRLQHAIAYAKRHPDFQFAVLCINVDQFKVFNESLGYTAGDQLLVQIGHRLKAGLRTDDMVSRSAPEQVSDGTLARLGGDEFTVLLDDIRNPSDAIRVAERIHQMLRGAFLVQGQSIVVSASIGIALGTGAQNQGEDLLRDANIAMYRAKRQGKAHSEVFDQAMHASAVDRLKLETDLRQALEAGEFRIHYQPIVRLDGQIVGFEALLRWERAGTMVSPVEFIGVANETGLILPINGWLMREACGKLREWNGRFGFDPPLYMSLNVTAKQFAHPDLAEEIAAVLRETALPPSQMQLEIMETVAMADADHAARVLAQLKSLGVGLSIDDFGTGYSSLNRLQEYRVDTLKIDRSFVAHMESDKQAREIVRTIIVLAHNLGLKVVAEGTETAAQVEQLRDLGCELAQGFFFARPADEKAIERLLQEGAGQSLLLTRTLPAAMR